MWQLALFRRDNKTFQSFVNTWQMDIFTALCLLSVWLTLFYLWLVKDVPVVAVVTEEVKEQLVEASAVTKKAFTTYRREAEAEEHQAAAEGAPVPTADKGQEEGEMSVVITIMQPILRLMQLLCENHNRDLQVSHYSFSLLWVVSSSCPSSLARDMLTFSDLRSEFLLPHSVTQKWNLLKIGTICRTS